MYEDIGITFEPATQEHLEYIWPRLRDNDKKELDILGFDEKSNKIFLTHAKTICGLYKNEPVAIWGHYEITSSLVFFFFSTEKIHKVTKTFTKVAKSYVHNRIADAYPKHGMTTVWEEHTIAIRWLELIGFKKTKMFSESKGGRFFCMRMPPVKWLDT